MQRRFWIAGVLGVAAMAARPAVSFACGGCFAPPRPSEQQQVVTDHRMAMAIHASESILWDQIRYSGAPDEFSWVLPVSGSVQIELASNDFFQRLDALTNVTVYGPQPPSCPSRGGVFFGATANAASDAGLSDAGSVQVIQQQVVGPYDTVTLRSTDANALTNWLTSNGYVIPTAIQPVIASYVSLHMDFVALKLRPGEGVSAMQPVRIRYASAITVLPLRMVAAGVADKVGITLYVFGNGRWEAQNFSNATVNADDLVWNWDTNHSNYPDVFQCTIRATNGGRAWVTEFAGGSSQFQYQFGTFAGYDGGTGTGSPTATDDWALATNNSDPSISLTRMRTSLLATFLDQDLALQASTSSPTVSNVLYATHTTGESPSATCAGGTMLQGGGGNSVNCSVSASTPGHSPWRGAGVALAAIAAASGVSFARRRSRK